MKKYIYLFFGLSAILFLDSCNESSFLKETPEDFLSADNAYTTSTDFDYAINELYYLTRYDIFCGGAYRSMDYLGGTDLVYNASSGNATPNLVSDYSTSGDVASTHWNLLYKLIGQTNTIINRLPSSKVSSAEQAVYMAKAKFFRGFAYRTLAYCYGGVPLQLEEVTSPKYNYTRASREATILQAISDVKDAAENLPAITDVKDGVISSPAAYHLLAELYLAAIVDSTSAIKHVTYADSAISAATKVIDNSSLSLMRSRFGSSKSEAGDVYFDLFRLDNQNRTTNGNTEGIWVIQIQAGQTGGGTDLTSLWTTPGSYMLQRYCAPQTGQFKMTKNGTTYMPFTWPIGDYTGGRGIGTYVPTTHFAYDVWGGKNSVEYKEDIRNSNYNFVRKFKFNNTNATTLAAVVNAFGSDTIDIDKESEYKADGWSFLTGSNGETYFPCRYLTCYQTKCTTLYNEYPSAVISNTSTYLLSGSAGGTYTDQYMFRLAETYLLRAEAYLYKGDYTDALADINVVRNRSNAVPATSADLAVRSGGSSIEGMDYLLDERMRELGIEEKRRMTLGRLGSSIFVERVNNYNPYYSLNASDPFTSKYTLWPIPLSAIEANTGAKINQNPGY